MEASPHTTTSHPSTTTGSVPSTCPGTGPHERAEQQGYLKQLRQFFLPRPSSHHSSVQAQPEQEIFSRLKWWASLALSHSCARAPSLPYQNCSAQARIKQLSRITTAADYGVLLCVGSGRTFNANAAAIAPVQAEKNMGAESILDEALLHTRAMCCIQATVLEAKAPPRAGPIMNLQQHITHPHGNKRFAAVNPRCAIVPAASPQLDHECKLAH